MCVVSMIMDHYGDKWRDKLPQPLPCPGPYPYSVPVPDAPQPRPSAPPITPAEIEEFRRLLERAREYDKRNSEPDCELEEKRERLRRLARELGLDPESISFIEPPKK